MTGSIDELFIMIGLMLLGIFLALYLMYPHDVQNSEDFDCMKLWDYAKLWWVSAATVIVMTAFSSFLVVELYKKLTGQMATPIPDRHEVKIKCMSAGVIVYSRSWIVKDKRFPKLEYTRNGGISVSSSLQGKNSFFLCQTCSCERIAVRLPPVAKSDGEENK